MSLTLEKIKVMSKEELVLAIDRLTRFKFPEDKYNRVFREIISKYLISPKISFKDYEKLSEEEICSIVEEIFEKSIGKEISNCSLYKKVAELDDNLYVISGSTKKLMQAKIPYEYILDMGFDESKKANLCKNLQFWYSFMRTEKDLKQIRDIEKTMFPIEKVVLAEGITEEILLPKFAKIMGYDFDANGCVVIPAGGKNQVAKEYIKLRDSIKVPIVILLDADATEVASRISNKLREQDSLILIEKGEFEDILSLSLLKKAINYQFVNIFKIEEADFSTNVSRVKDLEEIYRVNGLGEFKKAEFAHSIDLVLDKKSVNFVSEEIKSIIEEIKKV